MSEEANSDERSLSEFVCPYDEPFTVVVDPTGDVGYCHTPEAALLAALTLLEDAKNARSVYGYEPTATFKHNKVVVRSGMTRKTLLTLTHHLKAN